MKKKERKQMKKQQIKCFLLKSVRSGFFGTLFQEM